MKWQIEIDEKHAEVLLEALDVYSRVLIGQFEEIVELHHGTSYFQPTEEKRRIVEAAVEMLKSVVIGMPINASFGIHNNKVKEEARIAWDLIQVIRHRIAWDRAGNPPKRDWDTMLGVSYDDPMQSAKHPMAKIEKKP